MNRRKLEEKVNELLENEDLLDEIRLLNEKKVVLPLEIVSSSSSSSSSESESSSFSSSSS